MFKLPIQTLLPFITNLNFTVIYFKKDAVYFFNKTKWEENKLFSYYHTKVIPVLWCRHETDLEHVSDGWGRIYVV